MTVRAALATKCVTDAPNDDGADGAPPLQSVVSRHRAWLLPGAVKSKRIPKGTGPPHHAQATIRHPRDDCAGAGHMARLLLTPCSIAFMP